MKIYFLSRNPGHIPRMLCDLHLCSLTTELAQILSSAAHILGYPTKGLYKPQLLDNPYVKWVAANKYNYTWTASLFYHLSCEFNSRFGFLHKSTSIYNEGIAGNKQLIDELTAEFGRIEPFDFGERTIQSIFKKTTIFPVVLPDFYQAIYKQQFDYYKIDILDEQMASDEAAIYTYQLYYCLEMYSRPWATYRRGQPWEMEELTRVNQIWKEQKEKFAKEIKKKFVVGKNQTELDAQVTALISDTVGHVEFVETPILDQDLEKDAGIVNGNLRDGNIVWMD